MSKKENLKRQRAWEEGFSLQPCAQMSGTIFADDYHDGAEARKNADWRTAQAAGRPS